jgi:hypothetical protein
MLLRDHSTRACQLPDLFTLEFQNEEVTPCWPVIMEMDQGKTNQFGKREYTACIQNKEMVVYPVGALAFYLLYRWHRGRERFPDFTSRRHWYDTFLLKERDAHHEIAYDTQLDRAKRAFASAGVVISKITHAPRGQEAREAETRGVTEFDIRRAGRWNSDTMPNVYLFSFSGLPLRLSPASTLISKLITIYHGRRRSHRRSWPTRSCGTEVFETS